MSSPTDQFGNQQQDMARQALGNLGGLGQAAPPSPPPTTLQEAIQVAHRMIEKHSDIIVKMRSLTDRINGPRPEKEMVGTEPGEAAGQLAELHRLLAVIESQTDEINRTFDVIDHSV